MQILQFKKTALKNPLYHLYIDVKISFLQCIFALEKFASFSLEKYGKCGSRQKPLTSLIYK